MNKLGNSNPNEICLQIGEVAKYIENCCIYTQSVKNLTPKMLLYGFSFKNRIFSLKDNSDEIKNLTT